MSKCIPLTRRIKYASTDGKEPVLAALQPVVLHSTQAEAASAAEYPRSMARLFKSAANSGRRKSMANRVNYEGQGARYVTLVAKWPHTLRRADDKTQALFDPDQYLLK